MKVVEIPISSDLSVDDSAKIVEAMKALSSVMGEMINGNWYGTAGVKVIRHGSEFRKVKKIFELDT